MSSRASELESSKPSDNVDQDDRDLEAELASSAAGRFGIPVDAICVGCGRTHVKRASLEEMDQPLAGRSDRPRGERLHVVQARLLPVSGRDVVESRGVAHHLARERARG